jgi:hypothetical protein
MLSCYKNSELKIVSFWIFTFTSDNDSPPVHVSELQELEGDGDGGRRVIGDTGSILISSLISKSATNSK